MKPFKYIGIIFLICFTFFYTEKIIDVSIMQDSIMIEIQDNKDKYFIEPKNAIIDEIFIIPGNVGKEVNINKSYKEMKRLGYYDESLLCFDEILPEVSIYNNLNKYVIKGNIYAKNVSLIFIIKNKKYFNSILDIINNKKIIGNFFVDNDFLNNNIDMIDTKHEIYNYGNNGKYTNDNIIVSNNIINNKSGNKSLYCLFLEIDENSHKNCIHNKMLSINPSFLGNINNVKKHLDNGSIILINNTYELSNIIDYIKNKGYNIVPLSNLIVE